MSNPITSVPVAHSTPGEFNPADVDMPAMRAYRFMRVQAELRAADCAAILVQNPVNIRYATDTRNMSIWLMQNPGRYCLIPAEGRAVLFDYPNMNCLGTAPRIPEIAEVRLAQAYSFQFAAEHSSTVCSGWAAELDDVLTHMMGRGPHRLAIDRVDFEGVDALRARGHTLVEGQRLMELARTIKSAEELACMRYSLKVADLGMQRMHDALRPGITEMALWAELHFANIANGGEWIETRLLSSGPRTNPWLQEASNRAIEAGDLVSFDTDLVGPYGYCADVSRTFLCGNQRATAEQQLLYELAVEQVEVNCALLRPGLTFRDYTKLSWTIPSKYMEQNYGCVAHGVGMVDEWPGIAVDADDPLLMDGVFRPGMTICVESYLGEVGARYGVKLEQQVLITETGHDILSRFPLEPKLRR